MLLSLVLWSVILFCIKFCCHHFHYHQSYHYHNFCHVNILCGTFFVTIKFDVTINHLTANVLNCYKCYCCVSSTHFVQFWIMHLLFHLRSCCWCLQIWSCYCIQVRCTCIIYTYFFLSYIISGPLDTLHKLNIHTAFKRLKDVF